MSTSNPSSSSGAGPCGACKFLRRKCIPGCIFAPYFDAEQGAAQFAAVHKVFGASNVSKLLLMIPVHKRLDAVVTICYEAQARIRDPVYGCVAHIFALQQQVVNLQAELSYIQAHLATLQLPQPQQPSFATPPFPPLSISDLPTISSTATTMYDLSMIFDPTMPQSAWAMQPRQVLIDQLGGNGILGSTSLSTTVGGGDFQSLAQELLNRQGSRSSQCMDNPPSGSTLK